jgi:predicted outer membrane repeat protein
MWLPSWLRTRKRHGTPRRRATFRPLLEALEGRTVPSQIGLSVTSPADSGPGTLRAAILTADAGSPSDKFTIGFAVTGTIDLQSPLPDLDNTIAIQGPGAASLTVERAAGATFASAIVTVGYLQTASLSGLTIANGALGISNLAGTLTLANIAVLNNHAGPEGGSGGIYNAGTMTVTGSTIAGNSGPAGAGIDNDGTLSISRSTVSRNTAVFVGGGLRNTGPLTISSCDLSQNSASEGGGIFNSGTLDISGSTLTANSAIDGGGIYNEAALTVSGCTLAGNSATGFDFNAQHYAGHGGGIYNLGTTTVRDSYFVTTNSGAPNSADLGGGIYNAVGLIEGGIAVGTLDVRGSTFTGNSASDSGGALYNLGAATVQESTLSGNTAGSAGGGIFNGASGTLAIDDSVVCGNTASHGADLYNLGVATINDSDVCVIDS